MSVIELKVCKNMIDFKFEGYKLSLDPIPVLQQPVVDGVKCIELSTDDYSYLQTRMALLQNYLFQDPHHQDSIFYINKKNNVLWTALGQDGRLAIPRCVWSVPAASVAGGAVTVAFPGADWALLSNGTTLHVLYTSSRAAGEPWTCFQTFDLEGSSTCYLLHATHRSTPIGQQIDCAVANVEHKSSLPQNPSFPDDCSFVSVLEWITLACGQNNQSWSKKRIRKLAGPSFPEYVAIDAMGDSICIVSKDEYKLYFDSEGTVNCTLNNNNKSNQPAKYTYIQTAEEVTVYFRLPDDMHKSDLQVNFKSTYMEVLIKGKTVLSGQLGNCVDRNSCTWTIDKDRLEIFLSKAEAGLMWQELLKGNREGEELMDKALVEEIHARLAHLTSDTEATPSNQIPFNLDQLEECDSSIEEFIFQRIDGNEHKETHRVNLCGHQWLFSKQICPESLPTICLRHDVDGILWQPKNVCSEGDVELFKISHLATFSALGYVLASKQDKKFITSAPDFEYSVVSDCSRHLYLYCQPESLHSSLELRNRRTGESIARIAKQYVISLEHCDKILGLQASSQCIFVLSKDTLYAAKVASK